MTNITKPNDAAKTASRLNFRICLWYSAAQPILEVAPAVSEFSQAVLAAQMQFKRDISRSRFRQKIWISLVAAEIAFLVFAIVKFA